jgi:hypothetical protein
MRRMSVLEFEHELELRDCKKIGTTKSGYSVWETETGDPFSVSPPEEDSGGELKYPDWLLDDLIAEVGIPAKRKTHH